MATEEEPIGTVEDYRADVDAAKIHLDDGQLAVGDTIRIRGNDTEVEQTVGAIQLPTGPAEEAEPGDDVGLKIPEAVEEGAMVFRVTGEDPYDRSNAGVIDQVFEV